MVVEPLRLDLPGLRSAVAHTILSEAFQSLDEKLLKNARFQFKVWALVQEVLIALLAGNKQISQEEKEVITGVSKNIIQVSHKQ